jgi:hypothetical protein
MISKIVGQLSPTDYDPDFFYSQPFPIPYFDNKKLKIGFVEAKFQPYLDSADRVLENFIELNPIDKIRDSELVNQYYSETLRHGYTKPLNVKTAKDIWNYVTPTEIILQWEDEDFYLCVSCECEWEQEHGLQLVYKNGQTLTRASGHDGHLTD